MYSHNAGETDTGETGTGSVTYQLIEVQDGVYQVAGPDSSPESIKQGMYVISSGNSRM